MKRFDGNPSGHINMDVRVLNFSKEIIEKEKKFLDQMWQTGKDQPNKNSKPGPTQIFPGYMESKAPLTDRGVKMFTDWAPQQRTVASTNDSAEPAQISMSALARSNQYEEIRRKGEAAARHRATFEHLSKRKAHLEKSLRELDAMMAFKHRQEVLTREVLSKNLPPPPCTHILCST